MAAVFGLAFSLPAFLFDPAWGLMLLLGGMLAGAASFFLYRWL